jgi:hypothetical protein
MRCVDRVCSVLRPEARGLGGERFVVALAGGRLDAVLARWRGDGPTLSAFLAAASRERSRAQHAELGEILSIEEALRLEVAYHRLSALVPLHPDNPFVPYFMARNAAARHLTEPALAGLEALAADPTARALAARALAERHAEWEPLRSHPRYIAAQAGLMRQIPNEPELFAAWLVRHRASAPHLEVAVLPGGPPWYTLAPHLEAFARLSPAAAQGPDGEARAVATPDGPLVLQLGRDAAGRLGLRGLSAPTASGSSPPAPPRP